MRLKGVAAFVFAVVAAAGAGRAADVDDATQKAITANYALICSAAFAPNDANLDAAFGLLAPEFVNFGVDGNRVTRDEIVGRGKQQMKMLHATACDNKVESMASDDPSTVVVVNTLHLEGDLQTPDGKHTFVLTNKAQDTWKNVGGKWLQSQAKELRVLVKVDGNVVQDQGA